MRNELKIRTLSIQFMRNGELQDRSRLAPNKKAVDKELDLAGVHHAHKSTLSKAPQVSNFPIIIAAIGLQGNGGVHLGLTHSILLIINTKDGTTSRQLGITELNSI